LKSEDLCILSTKKNNLGLHDYQKLRKRKDENIISSVGKKMRVSFFFFWPPPSFPLPPFFYLKENPTPYIPTSSLVSSKKKL